MSPRKENTQISFKEALEKVASIVAKLEGEDCELEEMASLYEQGVSLLQLCEKKINDTKLKIEQINAKEYTPSDPNLFFDNEEK